MNIIVQANNAAKELIPAVIHEDGTARIQTVTEQINKSMHKIICEFEKLSGIPVVINTSFNTNGESIVETYLDAIESFLFMDIDYLAIENIWIVKRDNLHLASEATIEQHLNNRKTRANAGYFEELKNLNLRLYGSHFTHPAIRFIIWFLNAFKNPC